MNLNKSFNFFKKIVLKRACSEIEIDERNARDEWSIFHKISKGTLKKNLLKIFKLAGMIKLKHEAKEGYPNLVSDRIACKSKEEREAYNLLSQMSCVLYTTRVNGKDHFVHPLVYYFLKDELEKFYKFIPYQHVHPTLSIRTIIDMKKKRYIKMGFPFTLSGKTRILTLEHCSYATSISNHIKAINIKTNNFKILEEYDFSYLEGFPMLSNIFRKIPNIPNGCEILPLATYINRKALSVTNELEGAFFTNDLIELIIQPLFEVFKLYAKNGIALEIHGQNILLYEHNGKIKFYYRDLDSVEFCIPYILKNHLTPPNSKTFLRMYNENRFYEMIETILKVFFPMTFLDTLKDNPYVCKKFLSNYLNKNISIKFLNL